MFLEFCPAKFAASWESLLDGLGVHLFQNEDGRTASMDVGGTTMTIRVDLIKARNRACAIGDIAMIGRLAEIARADRERNARYSVVQSEIVGMRRVGLVVASGLEYDAARQIERDLSARLAAEHPGETSWTRPLALLQMEPRVCMVEVPADYFTDAVVQRLHTLAA